jgi:hypothetical protein
MPKSDTAFLIGQRAALAGDMVETGSAQIKAEMRAILDAVLDLGDGDPALTPMRGFQAGLLDIPFAAGRHCRGEVMVARDAEGTVRYLDPRPPDRLPDDRRRHILDLARLPGDGLSGLRRAAFSTSYTFLMRRVDQRIDPEFGRNAVGPLGQVAVQRLVCIELQHHEQAAPDLDVTGLADPLLLQRLQPVPEPGLSVPDVRWTLGTRVAHDHEQHPASSFLFESKHVDLLRNSSNIPPSGPERRMIEVGADEFARFGVEPGVNATGEKTPLPPDLRRAILARDPGAGENRP